MRSLSLAPVLCLLAAPLQILAQDATIAFDFASPVQLAASASASTKKKIRIGGNYYVGVMLGLLVGVVGLGFVLAMIRTAWTTFKSHRSLTRQKASAVSVYTKKWLLMPALWGKAAARRPKLFGISFSIPTRVQSVLVFLYVSANFWALYYPVINNRRHWKGVTNALGSYAIYNTTILFVFAGRNMPLIWLTGSSYSDFNVFHKWIGRMIGIQVFIHAVIYTWSHGGYPEVAHDMATEMYWRWGVLGMVAIALIYVQASHKFRSLNYEIFLIGHIILAICFVMGAWYHLYLHNYIITAKWAAYLPWLIGTYCLWGADRLARLARITWYNIRWGSNGLVVSKAKLRMEHNLVRIDVKLAHDWNFKPGQYCFVHIGAHFLKFIQSHPFTIISYEEDSLMSSKSSYNSDSEKRDDSIVVSGKSTKTMTLLVRPHKGITEHLKMLATESPEVERHILIEGPYGTHNPTANYDNVVLIGGGVGINSIIAGAKHAVFHEEHARISVILVCHSRNELAVYRNRITPLLASCPNLHLASFVTTPDSQDTLDEKTDDDEAKNSIRAGHRPDLTEMLKYEADFAGSMAVVACGPATMMDDCRATCTALLSTERATLDYFPEYFEW